MTKMATAGNELKKLQLGMAPGTARNKLQKSLMFMFSQKCDMDKCFQCGEKIKSMDELTLNTGVSVKAGKFHVRIRKSI